MTATARPMEPADMPDPELLSSTEITYITAFTMISVLTMLPASREMRLKSLVFDQAPGRDSRSRGRPARQG